MAWPVSNFPTALDTITDRADNTDDATAADVNGVYDCIEKLEAKVGVNSSAVNTSLDYLLRNASSSNPGHKHTLAAGATDVTATAAELNILDGVTATTAELNILDGVTATAAELNILDGVTATAKELNTGFQNISLAATVSDKALAIALKGADGNDPSATNPVKITFRSSTLTNGRPCTATYNTAKSIVLSAGSTLGFAANESGRIYVWAIYETNAGSTELAISRTADIFPESSLHSSTAEGGSGAADSATVMYAGGAWNNFSARCIGYIEITTGATAGEWDNAPTKIQLMGPGVRRTGDVVQVVHYQTGAVASGSTVMPIDDTIPQITEGDEYMTLSVAATSAINILKFEVIANVCSNSNNGGSVALFNPSSADALASVQHYTGSSEYLTQTLKHSQLAGTTDAINYRVRMGGSSGTMTFNGVGAARRGGGSYSSGITITEVMA